MAHSPTNAVGADTRLAFDLIFSGLPLLYAIVRKVGSPHYPVGIHRDGDLGLTRPLRGDAEGGKKLSVGRKLPWRTKPAGRATPPSTFA